MTYSTLLLSAAATAACLAFSIVRFDADIKSETRVIKILFAVAFVLAILTQQPLGKLTPNPRDRLLWRGVLRGCPRWMRIAARVCPGVGGFASLALALTGHDSAGIFIFFAGFYSISFCITYSFLHTELFPRTDRSTSN